MKKNRPWLRFIEGTDGAQAGGNTENNSQGEAPASAPAGPATSASAVEAGNDAAAQRLIDAVKEQAKQSEPPSTEDKAGEPSLADLLKRVEEQDALLQSLREAADQQSAERRTQLAVEVAASQGLPESLAGRLTGTTREEMESDAKELVKIFGANAVDPVQGRGGGKTTPATLDDAVRAKVAAAGLK